MTALTMLVTTPAFGQSDSLKTETIELSSADTSLFLGFLIPEESVNLTSEEDALNPDWWSFDSSSGLLTIQIPVERIGDISPVRVIYRPSVIDVNRIYRLREFRLVEDSVDANSVFSSEEESIRREVQSGDDLFGGSDLNQSGSLTRGFTVGNRQDLALDSGLQLDLNGNITDDITINASLTDRSTPIQPDGATQNIREFDRVYIQLNAPVGELELGDVDITYDESRFARINRRVQGAVGEATTSHGEFGGGASVARGQFRTQSFSGAEGVQGPYRLSGAENEAFIIVIAGSETVYVNGNRVNRGAENEYIIDYGLGEITFTNNLAVTDETRIDVEFQYITQNFTRTLFTARGKEDGLWGDRLSIGANYIREADNKNPNTQLNLAGDEIELLRQLDGEEDLFVSGADSVGFREDANYVQYAKVDTTFDGEKVEIFKNLPGDSRSAWRVRFSNLGESNGSYRRTGSVVNGILYEWVGPGLGRYEPVVRLQAPKSHQMLSVSSELQINRYLSAEAEWAVSEYDGNRFATGNSTETDFALDASLNLSDLETGAGSFRAGAEHRIIGEKFRFFDRPREVEFDRKWNLVRVGIDSEEEQQTSVFASLSDGDDSRLRMELGRLGRDGFEGRRAEIVASLQKPGVPGVNTRTTYVESSDKRLEQDGVWFRHMGDAVAPVQLGSTEISPFINWETEQRYQRSFSDTLLQQSLQFYDLNPGIRFGFKSLNFEAGLGYRENFRPVDDELVKESFSRSERLKVEFVPSGSFQTENSIQLRQKTVREPFLQEAASPESRGALLRSITNYDIAGGDINGEVFYEANTERRALLQETYVEVGPELGQYVWEDSNGDGVRQVDEFFNEITPNEGSYIRQFVPSDELQPVIDLVFRVRNELSPGALAEIYSGGEQRRLSRIRINSLFEIRETSREQNLSKVYFLNASALRDSTQTISGQEIQRHRIAWRSENRDKEFSVSYNHSKSLTQRAVGVQAGLNRELSTNAGYQLSGKVRLLGTVRRTIQRNTNTRFDSRNYNINGMELNPGISIVLNRSAQMEWRTGYTRKDGSSSAGAVQSSTFQVENSSQIYLFNRLQNRIRLQLRHTNLEGIASGQTLFELTEGVGEGTNLVWSLNSDYRTSSLLRISLQYNGRTTSENKIIQTLRLVVSAVF